MKLMIGPMLFWTKLNHEKMLCPLNPRRGFAPGPHQGPLSGPLDPTPLYAPLALLAPLKLVNILSSFIVRSMLLTWLRACYNLFFIYFTSMTGDQTTFKQLYNVVLFIAYHWYPFSIFFSVNMIKYSSFASIVHLSPFSFLLFFFFFQNSCNLFR